VVFVVVNLIADLLYPLLDPRVKIIVGRKRRLSTIDDTSLGLETGAKP
jgi:peptide/nickel transport system permease protein